MTWKDFTEQIKGNYKAELQDCITHKWNPCYHVANWKHLKARIIGNIESAAYNFSDSLKDKDGEWLQAEIDNVISDIHSIIEEWLEYYKQHDKDGFYESWIECFWTEEMPDAETEEYYYMNRMYEKFLENKIIEVYYSDIPGEGQKNFLSKWYQRYHVQYSGDEELCIYIGQKGNPGKFYECIGDFYEPVDSPRESDWWKLVSKIIEEEKAKHQ